jgi:hypothetical protein
MTGFWPWRPGGICGGQIDTGVGFSMSILVFPYHLLLLCKCLPHPHLLSGSCMIVCRTKELGVTIILKKYYLPQIKVWSPVELYHEILCIWIIGSCMIVCRTKELCVTIILKKYHLPQIKVWSSAEQYRGILCIWMIGSCMIVCGTKELCVIIILRNIIYHRLKSDHLLNSTVGFPVSEWSSLRTSVFLYIVCNFKNETPPFLGTG